jgi:hypothetical protein
VREALPPTIFFFIGFNFVVFTTNLLVAQYLVAVSNLMLATIAALVVGKAVLVANKIPLLRRYDRAPLIQPILFKTAFYWVVVFLARLLERFVHFVLEGNPPGDFIAHLATTFSWYRFSARRNSATSSAPASCGGCSSRPALPSCSSIGASESVSSCASAG